MGGSSKKSTPSQAATPTPAQPMQTIQPAMPGQLDALSQQLAAGFGQAQPDMLAYLQQFYKPMQIPDYSAQPAAATPPPAAPASEPATPGSPARQRVRDHFNRSRGGGS